MTVQRLMELFRLQHPDAYPPETKTGWINDLESSLWTEIFLMPAGMRSNLIPLTDGCRRLLLPDNWARLYMVYLAAMAEFANGEFTRYENSMAMYNGYLNELGAWYGETYTPADRPAVWAELGVLAYNDSETDIPMPAVKGAVIALECRIDTAFNGGGDLSLGTETDGTAWMGPAEINGLSAGVYRRTGLLLRDGLDSRLKAAYSGTGATAGQCSFRALIQPEA